MKSRNTKKSEVADALRELVSSIYQECVGAYGAEDSGYEGQYEKEIQEVAAAIASAKE